MTREYSNDFFHVPGVAYLNCAFHGALPRVAAAAAQQALEMKKTPYLIRDEYHFSYPDDYRAAAAALIGAEREQIAVSDSTTHAMMLLVNGLSWQQGDEIVLPRGEFPSNLLPWRSLESKGVRVHQIDIPRPEQAAARIEAVITERTRLVSASWVGYSSGTRLDVRTIGDLCRERNVFFAIDGSQGLGGLPFDLQQTPCDLLACSGYKWLLGPYGLGFAYVSPDLTRQLELSNINWFAVEGANDLSRLGSCELVLRPGARRFDVNETANFINLAAGTASLNYLRGVAPNVVEAHNRSLLDRLIGDLPSGFRVVSDLSPEHRSNIVCVSGQSAQHTERVYQDLSSQRIAVSHREGALRISPHLYNTVDDIERLLEVLHGKVGAPSRSHPVGEQVPLEGGTKKPTKRSHEGRYVSLHPLRPESDIDDLFAGGGGREAEALWTYMPVGPFSSQERMRTWLADCARSEDPLVFVVADNVTSRRIGMASFMNIVPQMKTLELGAIWYAPSAQGTRANTETVVLMLSEAFDRLGYRRVEWKCDALNEKSRRAALRLGFEFEGEFRKHMIIKGRNRDTAWFAMLDNDWQVIKPRLEAWLAEDSYRPLTLRDSSL